MEFDRNLYPTEESERELLRLLCQATCGAPIAVALRELAGYAWLNPEHRIVFEALREVRARDWFPLLEQLPAHATRAGFPDVDWEAYFQPVARSTDIDALVGELKRSATSS
jgi:hypothetical protein